MKFTENAKNIKLSERTKQILIALAAFEDSFWELCELLTEKSDDEKIQDAFVNEAEKRQKNARNHYYETINEIEKLMKDNMFQTFYDSSHKEI